MTRQALSNRDLKARSAIESVLRTELALSPKKIFVTARENHSGEPALYVLVEVASEQDVPGEPEQNRLVVRMIEALNEIDDSRFPYLTFGFNYSDADGWEKISSTDEEA